MGKYYMDSEKLKPEEVTCGDFERTESGKFDDNDLVKQLIEDMNDRIGQFGPLNVPNDFKVIEMMGILQARKWYVNHYLCA